MCLAASEISAKALMQSFEVQKKTMDKQLQIKFVGEDRDIFSTAFQLLRKLLPSDVYQGIEGVIRYTEGTITVMQFQMKCAGEECLKQNEEFQTIVTAQCETQKLDPTLPFCSTPVSVAASEMTTKAVTEPLDIGCIEGRHCRHPTPNETRGR